MPTTVFSYVFCFGVRVHRRKTDGQTDGWTDGLARPVQLRIRTAA